MELSSLRIFQAVARERGVTRAAERLHCVQSNVTTRLRKLEEELGAVLFVRQPRAMLLTSQGRILLDYANRILGLADEAGQILKEDGRAKGPLALGVFESTAALRLPGLLAAFHRACPEVELSLSTGTTSELTQGLADHRLDGVFTTEPAALAGLKELTVFWEELVLVTPARDRPKELSEALPEKPRLLVFPRPCSYRERLEGWLRQQGRPVFKYMELATVNGIIGCVAAGMGITLLPRAAVERAILAGEVAALPLPPEVAWLPVRFALRREEHRTKALASFLDLLETEAEEAPRT